MDSEVEVSSYELDRKRETFARLVASASDIGEAYNIAFRKQLPETEAFERGEKMCHDEYVSKRIKQFYDDEKVWQTVKRKNVAVKLERLIDCNASDYFCMNANGAMKIKPIEQWTEEMKAAFKGVKFTKNGIELMTYDKIAAANSISNMLGWDKTPEEVRKINDYSGISTKQLKDTLKELEDMGKDDEEE